MTDTGAHPRGAAGRPRAKLFLRIDLSNAYAQLGISPLATSEEIDSRIKQLRHQAVKTARARAQRTYGDAEEEIHRLDRINEEIGTAEKRGTYDEQHPQNVLLTVQPSPVEQAWQRHRRAAAISEWLRGELSDDACVPSPRCLRLWAPGGVAEELLAFLGRFAPHGDGAAGAPTVLPALPALPELPEDDTAVPVSPEDLEQLGKES